MSVLAAKGGAGEKHGAVCVIVGSPIGGIADAVIAASPGRLAHGQTRLA
jgi:hypothetical protein